MFLSPKHDLNGTFHSSHHKNTLDMIRTCLRLKPRSSKEWATPGEPGPGPTNPEGEPAGSRVELIGVKRLTHVLKSRGEESKGRTKGKKWQNILSL